jgi:hypothetical protein
MIMVPVVTGKTEFGLSPAPFFVFGNCSGISSSSILACLHITAYAAQAKMNKSEAPLSSYSAVFLLDQGAT